MVVFGVFAYPTKVLTVEEDAEEELPAREERSNASAVVSISSGDLLDREMEDCEYGGSEDAMMRVQG